jgi:flagellar hook protein FlgE
MLRSLFAGVSGMRNHQVRMDVIGNNIANVNTVSFKAGRVTFKEGFAQLLQGASRPPGDQGGINPIQVGLGMQIGSIDQLWGQGNIETTGQNTDLAIQGESLFVVRKGNQSFFTRSGNFQVDAEGQMVSPTNGFVVQGRMYQNGQLVDGIQDIKLPFGQKVSARPTSEMKLGGNLNAGAPAFVGTFDAAGRADPQNDRAWTETSLAVYDSQGSKWDVKVQLWKTAPNEWSWQIDPKVSSSTFDHTVSSAGTLQLPTDPASGLPTGYAVDTANVVVTSPAGTAYATPGDYTISAAGLITFGSSIPAGTQVKISYPMMPSPAPAAGSGVNSGTLSFDSAGTLIPPATTPSIDFAVPGAGSVTVNLNIQAGVNGLSQYAGASTAVLRDQDGYTAGQLENFSVDRSGLITGYFTNGTTSPLGQIVLADFNNPSGLLRIGDNMYQESANSGGAVLGFAMEGSQSQLTSGALEMSNVDLAQEFTAMIVAQRGFQANSKVVTTSDEMLQELMQLKR